MKQEKVKKLKLGLSTLLTVPVKEKQFVSFLLLKNYSFTRGDNIVLGLCLVNLNLPAYIYAQTERDMLFMMDTKIN